MKKCQTNYVKFKENLGNFEKNLNEILSEDY